MDERKVRAEAFEQHRAHLRGVAYRMLGSASEAEDAVQEAWFRLERASGEPIDSLRAWLTTVVSRVCLDWLRARKARKEESSIEVVAEVARGGARSPEQEAVLADSVGLALLVVLEALEPAERLAFVLHDLFAMPFEEIAVVVGRSPEAARQLASRARRRVQGGGDEVAVRVDRTRQKEVVGAFITALRGGDLQTLMTVLDPDLVVRMEAPGAGVKEIRGASEWAKGAVQFGKMLQSADAALVDGVPGLVWGPRGKLERAVKLAIDEVSGKIVGIEVIAAPEQVAALEIALLA